LNLKESLSILIMMLFIHLSLTIMAFFSFKEIFILNKLAIKMTLLYSLIYLFVLMIIYLIFLLKNKEDYRIIKKKDGIQKKDNSVKEDYIEADKSLFLVQD